MRFVQQQRCDRCDAEKDAGCDEYRRVMAEVDKALAEGECRATRHGLRLPPVQLTAWCAAFWRKGRK